MSETKQESRPETESRGDSWEPSRAELKATIRELLGALKKAVYELNTIRARDGVPYTHQLHKSDVSEEYFSSVVDESFAAIANAERQI